MCQRLLGNFKWTLQAVAISKVIMWWSKNFSSQEWYAHWVCTRNYSTWRLPIPTKMSTLDTKIQDSHNRKVANSKCDQLNLDLLLLLFFNHLCPFPSWSPSNEFLQIRWEFGGDQLLRWDEMITPTEDTKKERKNTRWHKVLNFFSGHHFELVT